MRKRLLLFILLIISISTTGFAQTNVKTLTKKAEEQFANYDYEACMETCKEILSVDAQNNDAAILRGAIFALFGQNKSAYRDLNNAIERGTKDKRAYYFRGIIFYQNHQHEAALKDFDHVLSMDPKHVATLRYRSHVYAEMGNSKAAMQDMEKALKLDPDGARTHFDMGLTQYQLGDGAKALPYLKRSLELGTNDSSSAYLFCGLILETMGKDKEAESHYRLSAEVNPYATEALSNLASLRLKAGDTLEALSIFEAAVQADSMDATSIGNYARCLMMLDRDEEALPFIKRSIAIGGPVLPMNLKTMGDYFLRRGETELAINEYNKALLKSPEYVEALVARGTARAGLGLPEKAKEDLKKAHALDPEDLQAHFFYGQAQMDAKEFENGRKTLTSYLKRVPDDWKAWMLLGGSAQEQGKNALAVEEFSKSLQCPNTDSTGLLYSRAICYWELKQTKEANADLDLFMKMKSQSATELLSIGYLLNQMERYPEALEILEQAIAIDSTFAYAYNNRGFAKYKLGHYQAAIEDFNKSIALKNDYFHWPPYNRANALRALGREKEAIDDFNLALSYKGDYFEALNDRGETWEKLGNLEKAVSDYKEALQANPDYEPAKANLQRLGK